MTEYLNLTPAFSQERSFKRLKIEEGTSAFRYAQEVYPRLEELARSMEYTHCYQLLPNRLAMDVPELDRCEKLAVCFSSCSEKIGSVTAGLMEEGAYLEAYILDDLINEILFNGSNELIERLKQGLWEEGYGLTCRYSPGEEPLGMPYQAPLLSVFEGEAPLAHVTLNESHMLVPEKSMLYLFGVDRRLPIRHDEDGCARCPNVNCFFRKE